MKITKILILSSVFIIALAGCAEDEPAVPVEPTPPGQQEQPPAEQQVTPQSNANMAAYNAALEVGDASFCEKIDEEVFRKTCEVDLKDRTLSQEALDQLDTSICNQLSNEDRKGACNTQIEAALALEIKRQEEEKKKKAEATLLESAVEQGDLSKCSSIEDENWRNDCILNITIEKVLSTKDSSHCNALDSTEQQDRCMDAYELAISQEN